VANNKEETALNEQLAELRGRIVGADSIAATVSSAEALLAKLRKRLDEPVSWEMKRRLIEILVTGVRIDTVEEYGVKQSKITVTYRFSEPDQAMPTVLSQSYSSGRVLRIPTQPQTVGDHIRRRRLGLKMFQREVAEQIGVETASVFNWEANTTAPEIRYMPAIIRFLGYNPLAEANGWGDRLVRHRTTLGLSQKKAALDLGVDVSTLARWERGDSEPTGKCLERVICVLGDEEPQHSRRAG
jgi:DNA-binding transcriptional regulator YiaG